jgi:L-alanine-DL-glutamate epimerase-like enolase superfamily enzyme
VPASTADDLVAVPEAGAVAAAQCEVVELGGMAPAFRGAVFADGGDSGVAAVSEALAGIRDRDWARRGGRSARGR